MADIERTGFLEQFLSQQSKTFCCIQPHLAKTSCVKVLKTKKQSTAVVLFCFTNSICCCHWTQKKDCVTSCNFKFNRTWAMSLTGHTLSLDLTNTKVSGMGSTPATSVLLEESREELLQTLWDSMDPYPKFGSNVRTLTQNLVQMSGLVEPPTHHQENMKSVITYLLT